MEAGDPYEIRPLKLRVMMDLSTQSFPNPMIQTIAYAVALTSHVFWRSVCQILLDDDPIWIVSVLDESENVLL